MRPKWALPLTPLRVAAAGPGVPFLACLHLDWAYTYLVPHTPCLYPKPPLKVEGLADMAPSCSLWASESPFRFLPKVLQEPAVETSGCACVFTPWLILVWIHVCAGCRASVSPATPFPVPQNRVAEGVASLALARPGTAQSVWFVVEATGLAFQSQVAWWGL